MSNITFEMLQSVMAHKDAIDLVNASLPVALTEEEAKAAKDARDTSRATTADAVRDFVELTMELEAKAAGTVLRIGLELLGRPSGTCKNYGLAVEGFRKLYAKDADTWRSKSVVDAQKEMRSAEQVKKDALKAEFAPFQKAANAAQLAAILEFAKGIEGLAGKVAQAEAKKGKGKAAADSPSHERQPLAAAA